MVDLYQTEKMKVFEKLSRYVANCVSLLILLLKESQNRVTQKGVTQSGFTLQGAATRYAFTLHSHE